MSDNDNDGVTDASPKPPPRSFNGRRIPPKATHYRLTRENGDRCAYGAREGIKCEEWPIEELLPTLLEERFGPGEYYITWVTHREDGTIAVSPPMRGTFTIMPARAPTPAATALAPPSSGFACCGQSWVPPFRFCGLCGKTAAGLAAPASLAQGGAPSFMDGLTLAMQMHREVGELARADAARTIAREQQEFEVRIARINHQFEMDLRSQQVRFDRMAQSPAGDAPAVAGMAEVARAIAEMVEKVEELETKIDDESDATRADVEEIKTGMGTAISLAKEYAPHIGPVLAGVLQRAMTPAAAAATNGVAKA